MTSSSDLTSVVDDVARRITSGESVPDVRHRVLDRLHDRETRRWRLALVPAAAAIVIAVSFIARHPESPASGSIAANRVPATPAAAAGSHAVSDAIPAGASQTVPATVAHRPGRAMATSQTSNSGIPALAALEPISVGDIQPSALEIRPLLTTPIVVPPLPQGDDETDTN
jgi:hypothetical protein